MRKYLQILMTTVLLMAITVPPLWAERLALSVDKANVRSGPGTGKYAILWEIEKYHPIQVIQKQGDWIFFKDFEGDEGWIHKRLVNKTPSVITRKDMVNIRSGPGTERTLALSTDSASRSAQRGDTVIAINKTAAIKI